MPAQGRLELIAPTPKGDDDPMRKILTILAALTLALTACADNSAEETPETLTLIAHDSFAGPAEETGAFDPFTAETGIDVEIVAAGDAGSLVNQAILTRDNPLADVLFGVDDTFLSRALEEEIFVEHQAENLDSVDPDLIDRDFRVTPIDFGDVCINFDKAWFEQNSLQVPSDIEALGAGMYAEHFTVEHPATSSPGLAFMLATIDEFGEEGWLDYWSGLRNAGVNVVSDWDSAYYGEFTRYGGSSSLVVSYASSPPAEVIFADEPLTEAPTGVITDGCYRQVEYAGILDGTEYPGAAGDLVDFMLSVDFQETIPLKWFVFPANENADLPEEFVEHTVIPESPARFAASYIAENRDNWIDQWIEVMEG
jgi:thiamine transport system substrate-binding protein